MTAARVPAELDFNRVYEDDQPEDSQNNTIANALLTYL